MARRGAAYLLHFSDTLAVGAMAGLAGTTLLLASSSNQVTFDTAPALAVQGPIRS
jgi:hypothetical protein